jgi:hypothetical protein
MLHRVAGNGLHKDVHDTCTAALTQLVDDVLSASQIRCNSTVEWTALPRTKDALMVPDSDQAWVEQKNGSVVRRLVGYGQLQGREATAALARHAFGGIR